jgi:hypothetical protein
VKCYLTRKETEPWEIIYFRLYKTQLQVVERALEIAEGAFLSRRRPRPQLRGLRLRRETKTSPMLSPE